MRIISNSFCVEDLDRDGSITPVDFEILADKLSSLVGQDDLKRREDYANARKTLCQEIMRADVNHDGKVTLGKFIFSITNPHSSFNLQKNGSNFIVVLPLNYANPVAIRNCYLN